MKKYIDKQFSKIGYVKTRDNKFGVTYEKHEEIGNYTHVLDFLHKASGKHIVQSYDKDLFDSKNIGLTNVGLNLKELWLCCLKLTDLTVWWKM